MESFDVPRVSSIPERDSFLVTFYKSELSLSLLLEKLRVDETRLPYSPYGDDTISLNKDLFDIINKKVPYLVSMISTDLSKVTLEDLKIQKKRDEYNIPSPQNEPVIGVIDTFFDDTVYFKEWVDNHDYLDEIEVMGACITASKCYLTPEQAIAATLSGSTLTAEMSYWVCRCVEYRRCLTVITERRADARSVLSTTFLPQGHTLTMILCFILCSTWNVMDFSLPL